ncbi:unnamed protein product [Parnassius mnemosyne]|uniref:FLYWCH-type domain-containing protein n=1 Tax=Parnassius mnemosyne TaxID=213953 RepID=A0AAV1KBB8_9NEOP
MDIRFTTTGAGRPLTCGNAAKGARATPVTWTVNSHGKDLVLINGYSFYCHRKLGYTDYWYCTAYSSCRARVIFTKKREALKASLNHNHQPRQYVIHKGIYRKL